MSFGESCVEGLSVSVIAPDPAKCRVFYCSLTILMENAGVSSTAKLSVSKAELGGSNPSARAKFASEAEVDIAQVS